MPSYYRGKRDHEKMVALLLLYCVFKDYNILSCLVGMPFLYQWKSRPQLTREALKKASQASIFSPKKEAELLDFTSTIASPSLPVTGYTTDSPGSSKNGLLLFHFYFCGGELFDISLTFLFCVFVFS